jgi:hypothetical protein
MRVSDEAAGRKGKCKDCGNTVVIPQAQPLSQAVPKIKPTAQERELYSKNPSMFRNRPILFILYLVLIVAYGLGLLLLLAWWFIDKCTTLTVTDKRTTLRRGFFSKRINEVWHKDVRNVLVEQSFFQRILGTGTIGISSSGSGDVEIRVAGMPSPYKVKQFIDAGRS